MKEKVAQDRVIRETQDTLQDKVAIAELNMFEAKFAGYTTKLEYHEVLGTMCEYTRNDVTERILQNVKDLNEKFEDYTRTARIEQQLQELRDWINNELLKYAKVANTTNKFEELQTQFRDQASSFERQHSMMDDKIRGLSSRMTAIYGELNEDINQRAMDENLQALQRELKKYALRAETDAFQQVCVPKLKFCVDSIKAFDNRLKMQDDAIQRVDEVLLDKAGKYDIAVANQRIEECFHKERAIQEFQSMFERLDWMNKKLDHYIEEETERFNQFRPPDYTAVFEDISARLKLKADKADMVEMYQLKANRIDSDELAKLHETIQRQLEYLAVTSFGLCKLLLVDVKPSESKTARTQQKSQVLMQSEALWQWILSNEPPPNLDTLQPSLSAKRRQASTDQEKRRLDDQKRHLLEKQLGINLAA